MERRQFLAISLVGLGSLLLPSQAQAMTTIRSLKASNGQILGLSADGTYWQVRTNLGPDYTVLGIYQNQNTYYAKVSFQGHSFFLKSTDGATWYTAEWTIPSNRQSPSTEKLHG